MISKTLHSALIGALVTASAAPLAAEPFPLPVENAIEAARADCASFENGEMSMTDDAARAMDLTGTGEGWVVDTAQMSCSSAASMFCGNTGGCQVTFIVGDQVLATQTRGWQVVPFFNRTVILLDVHGSRCGGINPTPCVEARTWDTETKQFTSIAPPAE